MRHAKSCLFSCTSDSITGSPIEQLAKLTGLPSIRDDSLVERG